MERCDVLIVGGGPAGSSCARALSQAGLDALVLDRAVFPRDKTCAGWITPEVLESLEIAPEEYRIGRVLQPIDGFRTGIIGARAIETRYGEVVSYGIRRCEFDHYLLERSGGRLRTGVPVGAIRRDGDGWIVGEAIRAPVLVGAGGHFCPVARFLAGTVEGEPIVAAREVEFRMDPRQLAACAVRGDTPELYFCPDRRGYGWCFRKGEYLNVGFGRQDRHGVQGAVRSFVAWLGAEGRIPGGLPERWKGHAYLLHDSAPRPLLADGVLLVGDAAGFAHGRSGEGIGPAVESGLIAARTIVAARGRYRREALEPYRAEILDRFGPRGRRRGLGSLAPEAFVSFLGARLLRTPWFTRRVVLDRWFLHRGQPPLRPPAGRPSPEHAV